MFTRSSPLKRKHSEFQDPDYHQHEPKMEEDDAEPCSSTDFKKKKKKSFVEVQSESESAKEIYLRKVRQVIEREFQREIEMKKQQLDEIDERLVKAKNLLNRLRYGIVCAYYKKQEIPLTAADAASLRSSNCLFEREEKGPQMPLHPSVKKLVGKKPKDIIDVMRSCPKRTAAQNAVLTIRSKSQAQKREERKLKKIIRDQGIVIDHSKQNSVENDVNELLYAAAQNKLCGISDSPAIIVKKEKTDKEMPKKPSGKSLNASRLNNKVKHLIVVGNTSKYIGNEVESDVKSQTKNLNYKWLVYVQSKDTEPPIGNFIRKVRFYLHQSYRPNDVIDIESPPFQISRRGWGEFPIRVQLFFHSDLHQKPIQLIHNIILDQTLSGIQTLGAETLLEIWLRDLNKSQKDVKDIAPKDVIEKESINSANVKNDLIPRTEELVDDNLLDFLNKIEASKCSISADIEKIQPTVVVNEPLGVVKSPSPKKYNMLTEVEQKSPKKTTSITEPHWKSPEKTLGTMNLTNNSTGTVPQTTKTESVIQECKTSAFTTASITSKPITTFIKLPMNSSPVKFVSNTNAATNINLNARIPPLSPIPSLSGPAITVNRILPTAIQKPSIILNKDAKIIMPSVSVASAVRRTVLPIAASVPATTSTTSSQSSQLSSINKPQLAALSPSSKPIVFNTPKQILQKKLVQLVDSTGKVKYIQMLVAANTPSLSTQNLSTSSVAPKLITMTPSSVFNSTVTTTTQNTNTITTPLLKSPNGTLLMPAKTTKPNIFKIVPENIQTKPQILTFSTTSISMANTNKTTFTNANEQQKLQHSITTTAENVEQITKLPGQAKSNSVPLPVANSLQKVNVPNSAIPTKNVVFQKEGKLCIIDAEQIKYKQQQKKQVSLLKPQISLLKQKQQQQKLCIPAGPDIIKTNPASTHFPQVLLGSKQQRINSINALQLMQMKRMVFEKQFLRQEFTNVRAAVEFLLRRLKLVVSKDSLVSDFPFVSYSLQEFHSLTAFKQRAYEWLRAKHISRLIRNHKDLQNLNNTSKETFWTTKEIATFARQYAYTPPIKSLPKPIDEQETGENSTKGFMDLVKSELKQEHHTQYDTITDHYKIRKWVDKLWLSLEDYEHHEDQHQVIDVVGIQEEDCQSNKRISNITNTSSFRHTNSSLETYFAPPPHMENQCQLVSDICKDININLAYEEVDANIHYPLTQTILAHCLYLFVEKVLRQTIAFKQENSSVLPGASDSPCTLMPQDFLKVLASNSEFDFLTNKNFGSPTTVDNSQSSIKQEKP